MEEKYICMRCGFEFCGKKELKENPRERICPKCRSNSIRRLLTDTTASKAQS